MKNKKALIGIIILVIIIILQFYNVLFNNENHKVSEAATSLFNSFNKVENITKEVKDDHIKKNFAAVNEIYDILDKKGNSIGNIFFVTPIGYNGAINIVVGIDKEKQEITGIKVLTHEETPLYAESLKEDWFLERFNAKSIKEYLNLVRLDPKTNYDIVQITGATISSQAAVNGVNSAVGAFNYINNSLKMKSVSLYVPKHMIEGELETFNIYDHEKGNIKVKINDIQDIPIVKRTCILKKTTGTETEMTVEGPLLESVLEHYDINLKGYNGLGATGRDGYYTLISKEMLDKREIILAYNIDGKPLKEEDRPIRIVVPEEMGLYWVKMLHKIDLYEDIPTKNIKSIKVFDAFTKDIEPYKYEYYGSKDKSIEIGKILRKFDKVDPKGFFTMVSSDGLIKNETINMVSQRYFIKVEGENAPMNIAPNFKLGMNVKLMAYFSTTSDAVIFPAEMKKIVIDNTLNNYTGMDLKNLLEVIGVHEGFNSIQLVSLDGEKVKISKEDIKSCILINDENKLTGVYKKNNEVVVLSDLLEINIIS